MCVCSLLCGNLGIISANLYPWILLCGIMKVELSKWASTPPCTVRYPGLNTMSYVSIHQCTQYLQYHIARTDNVIINHSWEQLTSTAAGVYNVDPARMHKGKSKLVSPSVMVVNMKTVWSGLLATSVNCNGNCTIESGKNRLLAWPGIEWQWPYRRATIVAFVFATHISHTQFNRAHAHSNRTAGL